MPDYTLFTIWLNASQTKWHWHVEDDESQVVAQGCAYDYDAATTQAREAYDKAISAARGDR